MMWNTIPNEERLHLWKKLRDDIQELQLKDQLNEIAKFCSKMPYGARTLDYYDPSDWLTPWEILFHGSFCTSSISLLMFYTLVLLKNPPKVELYLVEDDDGVYLLPIINDQFVLNYELGAVNNYLEVSNDFKVLQMYTKEQIKNIT
jgi:hypothetical protein